MSFVSEHRHTKLQQRAEMIEIAHLVHLFCKAATVSTAQRLVPGANTCCLVQHPAKPAESPGLQSAAATHPTAIRVSR